MSSSPSSSSSEVDSRTTTTMKKEVEEVEVAAIPSLTVKNIRESKRGRLSSAPSEASSSGVSEMSDGSSSGGGGGSSNGGGLASFGLNLTSPPVSSCGIMDMVEESETSDYQRSTPSPRDDLFLESTKAMCGAADISPFKAVLVRDEFVDCQSKDLGYCDEIKDDCFREGSSAKTFYGAERMIKTTHSSSCDNDLKEALQQDVDEECKFSVMAAIANNRLSVEDRLTLIRDPKIMRSKVQVQIEKLPVKDLSPNMVVTVSEDLFSRVNVSPKRERGKRSPPHSSGDLHSWFARRTNLAATSLDSKSEMPAQLIRPAVLNVSPSKLEDGQKSFEGRFSSATSTSSTSSSSSSSNFPTSNPFLPPLKSSYLFGFNDDFECVPPEELIVSDDDDEEESDNYITDVEGPLIAKEGYEESVQPLIPCSDVKCRDEIAPSSGSEANGDIFVVPKNLSMFSNSMVVGELGGKKIQNSLPIKLRFPALQGTKNLIECKWKNCQMKFTTYGKLSDHLKAGHVISQVCQQMRKQETSTSSAVDSGEMYQCLWEGCKVYAKKSCSRSWLEKHVPTHGGKFAFSCIVSGCKQRFSSQKMLQRHVNSHFSKSSNCGGGGGCFGGRFGGPMCKKSADQSESTKNLKRAGVKLKYRRTVFSARIFDFFDPGVMAAIKHSVYDLETDAKRRFSLRQGDSITFRSRVMMLKRESDGSRKAMIRWEPRDLLDDEWLPIEQVQSTKSIKICHLPEEAKVKLASALYGPPNPPATSVNAGSANIIGSSNRRKSKPALPHQQQLPLI